MGCPCWAQGSPPAPGSVPPGKLQAVNRGWLPIKKAPLPLRERRTGLRASDGSRARLAHVTPGSSVHWGSLPFYPRAWGPAAEDLTGVSPTEKDEHQRGLRTPSSGESGGRTASSSWVSGEQCEQPHKLPETLRKLPTNIPDEYGYKYPPPSFGKPKSTPCQRLLTMPTWVYARNTRNKAKNPRDPPHTEKHWLGRSTLSRQTTRQTSSRREISQHELKSDQDSPTASIGRRVKADAPRGEEEEGPSALPALQGRAGQDTGRGSEAVSTGRGRVLHRKSNKFTRENERSSLWDKIKTKPTVFLHSSNEQFKREMKKKTIPLTKIPRHLCLLAQSQPPCLSVFSMHPIRTRVDSHTHSLQQSRPRDHAQPSSGVHCPAQVSEDTPRDTSQVRFHHPSLRLLLGHSQVRTQNGEYFSLGFSSRSSPQPLHGDPESHSYEHSRCLRGWGSNSHTD